MATNNYFEAIDKLSSIQKEAVDWNEGPLLLIAGPGSGKTRVLTCRIARILELSQDSNFRILGLTFTTKAADEMRMRVNDFVPGNDGRLFLGTFHSFCADILRQHGVHLGINPNFNIYSRDEDLGELLDDAVNKLKGTNHLISDLDKKTLPVIQRLKSFLIYPDNCKNSFKDADFGERMSYVYPAYEEQLTINNALDFNSLIFKCFQLFSEYPALAKRYQTVYKYICIDEFQDTNYAQYQFIRTLTGDKFNNVFIVADDDQIIYQWNGASHKRLEEFITDYSPKIIQLPMNYRCPAEVVTITNNLISHNFFRTTNKKPLEAFRPRLEKSTVRLLEVFPDFESEAIGVAQDIQQNHMQDFGSVVVLARNRKLLEGVEKALNNIGISAVISQRKSDFTSTPFVWLHSLLKLANEKYDRKSLEAVCGTFNQLTQIDIEPEEVVSLAQGKNLGYLYYWINLVREKVSRSSIDQLINQVSICLDEYKDYKNFTIYAINWFDELVSSLKEKTDDPSNEVFARFEEEKIVWDGLYKEIIASLGENLTLEAFLQELQMHSKEPAPKKDTVILMTIHGSKGKEFDHVYLVGLVEDELPSFQSIKKGDSSSEMEEERRNCFVAITRSIKTLTLSYAKKYRGWPKRPSRFLKEMGLLDGSL